MTERLSRSELLERSRAVLGPLGLHCVLEGILGSLGDCASRFAYFRNPHVILSLRLSPRAESQTHKDLLNQLWLGERQTFMDVPDLLFWRQRPPEPEDESGIHEGRTAHLESYIDTHGQGRDFELHRSGISFRVRASRTDNGNNAADARMLFVLSRCPIEAGNPLQLQPEYQWSHLAMHEFPSFGPLIPESRWLTEIGALPSVVDCFVVYISQWENAKRALGALDSHIPGARFRIVTRNGKTSNRVTLRPWNQNPVTGVMQPDWAYIVFDEIEMRPTPEVAARLGVHLNRWQRLYQVELETGPCLPMLIRAAELMTSTRALLTSCMTEAVPVYGRKYHRLLLDAGVDPTQANNI